ncbi:ABC transporter substrate-binding protein [Sulfodiicoccus acidiphilus]|uniref:ABC transporter substrate-binding protein n=1 Tax=Sulfodiicoccus acidiphilus TaxID=1670455 RepID=A0A348B2E4_9CREN|nr:MqnA/MqnD/SBP family protein [Sulfodiicoccus acidiphilus]BBD72346.1 ABC transporter substrate-binding protein [Sulfodiicoccus acidiphilus]GGT90127.1 ABC transporter substrate-binding protein [Sulfodiicoccus acidiphilus]
MTTIKVGALADSGDLYPFIPLMEGYVRPEGVKLEFSVISTVQDVNEAVLKKEVDVSVPSAALYPYVQQDYYILTSAVASAVDGITGMPLLSWRPMDLKEASRARLIVHGPHTTAFTLYKLLVGKYGKLIIVPRVLEEVKALGEVGDILVAVHETKMMYALRKLGKQVYKVTSMWDMWKEISGGLPMPMGTVVVNKDLGEDVVRRFKEAYDRSKRWAENNLEKIIPIDVKIMTEAQGVPLEEEVVKATISADITEYNVSRDKVEEGLKFFYRITENRGVLPKVRELNLL